MTGPENYLRAQALLETVADLDEYDTAQGRELLVAAQVHATLAVAAAVALGTSDQQNADDYGAWLRVASEQPAADRSRREADLAEEAEWDTVDSSAYQDARENDPRDADWIGGYRPGIEGD